MSKVYHPTYADVFQEVDDKTIDDWTEAGWRKTPIPGDAPKDDGKPAANK